MARRLVTGTGRWSWRRRGAVEAGGGGEGPWGGEDTRALGSVV
jgi:hypothetical protein